MLTSPDRDYSRRRGAAEDQAPPMPDSRICSLEWKIPAPTPHAGIPHYRPTILRHACENGIVALTSLWYNNV